MAGKTKKQAKIVCNNIWKVFGPNPERTLREMDRSLSRPEIQEQTGHVVAVKDVSFKVEEGEFALLNSECDKVLEFTEGF